jgi:hypothetical protein
VGESEGQKKSARDLSSAAILLRSSKAPQQFFALAKIFVVVMTTAISKYYLSERFLSKVILLKA